MARPLRLEFAGAVWHVTSRGNERKAIFREDADRARFLAVLARVVERFRWVLHAYVLMGNHYHLLVETREPTLSRGMRELNGIYTQAFNRRHRRVGHLLQGRFKAILVEKEAHLLELARYVVLNPVRAGLVESAGQWEWSSYRATAGLMTAADWLEVDWILGQFARRRSVARVAYKRFVMAGCKSSYRPWDQVTGQVFLGGEAFREEMRSKLESSSRSDEIPLRQRLVGRPSLDRVIQTTTKALGLREADLREKRSGMARALIAYLGRKESGARLSEIGALLSITPSTVSRLSSRAERELARNAAWSHRAQAIGAALKEANARIKT